MSKLILAKLKCKKEVKRRMQGHLMWDEYRDTENAGMESGKLKRIWT